MDSCLSQSTILTGNQRIRNDYNIGGTIARVKQAMGITPTVSRMGTELMAILISIRGSMGVIYIPCDTFAVTHQLLVIWDVDVHLKYMKYSRFETFVVIYLGKCESCKWVMFLF